MSNVIKKTHDAELKQSAKSFEMNEIEDNCTELLASAREDAEAVLARARRDAETIRDQAYRQGWDVGRREATERLDAEIRAELTLRHSQEIGQLTETLRQLVSGLDSQREPLIKTTRDDLLRLAVHIAERIVKKEVRVPGEVAAANLKHAISRSARRTQLVASVSRRDLETLRGLLPEMEELAGPDSVVKLVADPDIMPGGCLVRSHSGEVDATIETQLSEVERALLGETGDGFTL